MLLPPAAAALAISTVVTGITAAPPPIIISYGETAAHRVFVLDGYCVVVVAARADSPNMFSQ